MKRVFAILLSVLMLLSLAACGEEEANPAVVAYVEQNGDLLRAQMEQSFASSSGFTCTSTIEAKGDGFVINININELSDVPDATKEIMQETYDAMDGVFDALIAPMQTELPELEYFTINLCEKDGDLLASVTAGE